MNVGTAVMAGASAQGMFSAVGQSQLLMLLPETGSHMPSVVNESFASLDNLMLSFEFLSLDSNPVYDSFEDTFGYSKHYKSRNLNVIKNGSSILNLFALLVILLLVFIFQTIMLILKITLPKENTNPPKKSKKKKNKKNKKRKIGKSWK